MDSAKDPGPRSSRRTGGGDRTRPIEEGAGFPPRISCRGILDSFLRTKPSMGSDRIDLKILQECSVIPFSV